MNKRLGVLIVSVVGLALVVASSVFALNTWGGFRREKGVIVGRGGLLVAQPSQKEILDFVQAIDRITGKPAVDPVTGQSRHLTNRGVAKELKTAMVEVFEEELIGKVSVDYFEGEDGLYTAFASAQSPAYILPVPIGNMFLMEYGGSIYQICLEERRANSFLSLSVAGYDKRKAKDWRLSWGAQASVNPEQTKVLFTTNRLALTKQTDNFDRYSQIWIKDLATGEERLVAEGHYQRVLAWNGDVVYLARHEAMQERSYESVVALNISTKEQQVILRGLVRCTATFPFVVYTLYDISLGTSTLEVLNLLDGSKKVIPGLRYDHYESVESALGSKYVLVIAQPNRSSHVRDVVILNTETLRTRVLKGDEKADFRGSGFVDANTITVTVMHGTEEETYIFSLQEGR